MKNTQNFETKKIIARNRILYFYKILSFELIGLRVISFFIIVNCAAFAIVLYDILKENSYGLLYISEVLLVLFVYLLFNYVFEVGKMGKKIELDKESMQSWLALIYKKEVLQRDKAIFLKAILNSPEYYSQNKVAILNVIESLEDLDLRGELLNIYYEKETNQDHIGNSRKIDYSNLDFCVKVLKSSDDQDDIQKVSQILLDKYSLSKDILTLIIEKNLENNGLIDKALTILKEKM